MSKNTKDFVLEPRLVKQAGLEAFTKLDPRVQWRNPVMFVVYAGSVLTTGLWAASFGNPALAGMRRQDQPPAIADRP